MPDERRSFISFINLPEDEWQRQLAIELEKVFAVRPETEAHRKERSMLERVSDWHCAGVRTHRVLPISHQRAFALVRNPGSPETYGVLCPQCAGVMHFAMTHYSADERKHMAITAAHLLGKNYPDHEDP